MRSAAAPVSVLMEEALMVPEVRPLRMLRTERMLRRERRVATSQVLAAIIPISVINLLG